MWNGLPVAGGVHAGVWRVWVLSDVLRNASGQVSRADVPIAE